LRAEATAAGDGSAVHRVLALEQPTADARPLDAVLEDGYLWMLGGAEAEGAPS
jgi:hypothetical protein